MRKISVGEVKGKEYFVTVTPTAVKAAKAMFDKIRVISKEQKKRFGRSVGVSKIALEDIASIHGEGVLKGLDEDLRFEGIVTAALKGNKEAYDELHGTQKGRGRIGQFQIRKPR